MFVRLTRDLQCYINCRGEMIRTEKIPSGTEVEINKKNGKSKISGLGRRQTVVIVRFGDLKRFALASEAQGAYEEVPPKFHQK